MAQTDWRYKESETLRQTVAYDRISGWLFCQDGTKYSPAELRLLKDTGGTAEGLSSVHAIKKLFGGEIIAVEAKTHEEG